MKKLTIISVIFVFFTAVLLTNVAFAQRGRIDQRIRNQWHRIDRLLASGVLSPPQADSLHNRLRHIRRQFESARANGILNSETVQELNGELNRNSARINRMARSDQQMENGGERIHHRIRHQWQRIDHLVAIGRISDQQADFLRRHLGHIRSQFQNARNNGNLDFDTIHRLNGELDRNSVRINRMAQGENVEIGPLHLNIH